MKILLELKKDYADFLMSAVMDMLNNNPHLKGTTVERVNNSTPNSSSVNDKSLDK